jgi:uncharacterized protein (TIGR00297 family)
VIRPTVTYPIVVLLLIACLPGHLELAAAAWGILAFGDAAAGIAGRWMGGPVIPWNHGKRWAGLVAFVVVSLPVAALLVRWTQGGSAAGIGRSFGGAEGSRTWLLVACAAATSTAAVAESLDSAIDDNVLVPLAATLTLLAVGAIDPGHLEHVRVAWASRAPGTVLLALAALVALWVGAVSASGAVVGWALVSALLLFAGWGAVFVFSAFFVVGTGATWLGYRRKQARGLAQERGGRRGFTHALANSGAGVVFAFLSACGSAPGPWTLAMVSAFATAAFDTSASEVGQLWGRRHVLPTTLRRVPAGTWGAVSLEGTLGGVVGAAAVVAVAAVAGLLGWAGAACALAGASAGAMVESAAGASMKRQLAADSDLLNLGATLAGAGVAVALWMLLH